MSFAQFLTALRAAWLKIALMTILAGSIAFAFGSTLPKAYTAKARVMLNLNNSDPNQYSAMRSDVAAGYIATELRLIADDEITRAVVERLGWPNSPQVISAWQATGGGGDVTTWAAHQIAQNISPRQLEDSSIIEIYYSSSSLEAAKQIVGVIRSAYIDQSQKLRAEAARRASAWNRTQMAKALIVLKAAEAERAKFVMANDMAISNLAGGIEYQEHAKALAAVGTATFSFRPNATKHNTIADTLKNRINAFDTQIAVLRLRGEQNPTTLALEAERAETITQLAREDAVTQAGPNATADQIGLVRAQRDAAYLKARLRLLDRAPLYDKLAAMDRDIALKARRYSIAAAHVANFDAIAAAPTGLKVIGDIIAADTPSYPDVWAMTGVAVGAALALGIAFALLAELSRQHVRSAEELTFFVGAPVLAQIAGDAPAGRWRTLAARLRWPKSWRWRSRRDTPFMARSVA